MHTIRIDIKGVPPIMIATMAEGRGANSAW